MKSTIQWKDLFNKDNKKEDSKNNIPMIFTDTIGSNDIRYYFTDKIPQSIIKKSRKDALKNK